MGSDGLANCSRRSKEVACMAVTSYSTVADPRAGESFDGPEWEPMAHDHENERDHRPHDDDGRSPCCRRRLPARIAHFLRPPSRPGPRAFPSIRCPGRCAENLLPPGSAYDDYRHETRSATNLAR